MKTILILSTISLWIMIIPPANAASAETLHLLPWPKKVELGDGSLPLMRDSRIIATDPSLLPLAKVISDELFLGLGKKLDVGSGETRKGDILLKIDPALKGEAYAIHVADNAIVSGSNYAAVALGSVTLTQAIETREGQLSIPRLTINDEPDYRMRAVQMCIKHQVHQISKLKQGVDLCRQYKINTLALHMSNYQILWMLSPAFRDKPIQPGGNDAGKTYSLEEMKDLEEYGRQRGVAILPEWGPADFAMPGEMMHWYYKARQFGDIKTFDLNKQTLLDNPRFWADIDDMTRQLADVFSTSTYIHVGALDGETGHWETQADKEFMKANKLRGSGDVWAWILKRLHAINKKHGKETMAFEGVSRSAASHVQLPREIAFFAYQTWYYPSNEMLADGYRVLNAAWRPLYTVGGYPAREIYGWSPRIVRHNGDSNININLPKSDLFLGPLLSTWEGGEIGHLELLNDRGAAMAERSWNENAGKTWEDFNSRLKPVQSRLESILYPMGISLTGLTADTWYLPIDGRWRAGTECFADNLTITMKPRQPGLKVYYTLQDPYFIWGPDRPGPTNPRSRMVDGPVKNPVGIFRAQCFDASGSPVGGEYCKIFQQFPIQMTVEGAEENVDALGRVIPRMFKRKAVVKFSTPGGAKLRYRTTPPGTTPDIEYTGPITITKTTSFWVGMGKEGYQLQTSVSDDGFKENILTMDRLKYSTDAKTAFGAMELVCDGHAENPDVHWNGIGNCHLNIELAVPRRMSELEVVTWWGDGRAYRYIVEGSEDGKSYKMLVDMSKNNTASSQEGYKHKFDSTSIRFLRFHMLGNTTNNHGHLVEVRAFDGADKSYK